MCFLDLVLQDLVIARICSPSTLASRPAKTRSRARHSKVQHVDVVFDSEVCLRASLEVKDYSTLGSKIQQDFLAEKFAEQSIMAS